MSVPNAGILGRDFLDALDLIWMKRPRRKQYSGVLSHNHRVRPIGAKSVPKSLKPQRARALIRRFHVLQKDRHAILYKLQEYYTLIDEENYESVLGSAYISCNTMDLKDEKMTLVQSLVKIDAEISALGGLETYQVASSQGQTTTRGGDSSKKLVEWLQGYRWKAKPRALEIGCLSPENAISRCNVFATVTRIDLHSQHPSIIKQDFMSRALPALDNDKFEVILCSLVLNFVATPLGRGAMLARIARFMKPLSLKSPSILFIVLPLACVKNLRYMDRARFEEICASLGFTTESYHEGTKVAYWLMLWSAKHVSCREFSKVKLVDGPKRNNFCITLTGMEEGP